ncbi:hypothetical protein MRX96_003858 [Rhipicephalus microplus]
MALGAVFGSLGGAFLTQRFGRRWSFVTSALGLLATWLCIGLGHDVRLFFVARFANGFFTGFVSLVVPGAHCRNVSRSSPRHRRSHAPPDHHTGHAVRAHRRPLPGLVPAAAEAEFEAIAAIFPNYKTSPAHYMLAVLVMGAQQFSGINCILLSSTSLVATQEYMHTLTLLALIQFLVASLVVPFLDLAGRRKLLLLSTMVCSGSLITLGVVYYPSSPIVANGIETTTLHVSQSVVPVATASTAHQSNSATFTLQIVWERHLVLVFPSVQAFLVAGYSAGLGPVPWILAVELTPLRGDGMELGSVYAASWTAFFVTANYYSTTSTLQWLVVTLWANNSAVASLPRTL